MRQANLPLKLDPRNFLDPNNYMLVEAGNREIYVARVKLYDTEGSAIPDKSWLNFKLALQRFPEEYKPLDISLLTSAEWGYARLAAQKKDEAAGIVLTHENSQERSFLYGLEITDSVLAFIGGRYPPEVHDLLKGVLGTKPERNRVVLIEKSTVRKEGKGCVIEKARVSDVTEIGGQPFPREGGYIQDYDWETGLAAKVGPEPNPKFYGALFPLWDGPKGVKVIFRNLNGTGIESLGRFSIVTSVTSNKEGGLSEKYLNEGGRVSINMKEFEAVRKGMAENAVSKAITELRKKYPHLPIES